MDELTTQTTDEIAAIIDFLEQRLGRRSRWNGGVELSDDPDNFGKALWNGSISINRELAATDLRWRTEIHEALHHFSAGLSLTAYSQLRGWEEGVVEQSQRLLRDEVLSSLQVALPAGTFESAEQRHRYNGFIFALEEMREILNELPMSFYLSLLSTPLGERPAEVITASAQLLDNDRVLFQRAFARSFTILRRE